MKAVLLWQDLTDADFLNLARAFAKGAKWMYVESATQSDFCTSAAAWEEDFSVAPLWQVRLFNPVFELYARRLSFGPQGARTWRVRYLGDHPVWSAMGWNEYPEAASSSTTEDVRLLGYATGDGNEFTSDAPQGEAGSQPAARFFPAQLRYPGRWKLGQQAKLVVRQYHLSDGPINRWVSIEPHTIHS